MRTKILLIFFVFSFLFRSDHSFDQDLGRHIKLGEIITQTGNVPRTNLFSYTNPDFPFINTHWLFEVIAYWFNQTIGIQYFLLIKIILFLTSVWLILKIIPKESSTLLLPVSFIFFHVLRERLELRPEIFSFLFTALTLFILTKFLEQKLRWILLLPFIQLIWINTHIYFFIGLLIQAIYIIHIGYQHLRLQTGFAKLNLLTIIFVLSVLVSLLNPNGLSGFLYPLNVTKNYGYTIVENQTMFLLESINFRNSNFLFVKLSIGIIFLSLLISLVRRKFEIKNILFSLLGMTLALMNVRSFPYLVFLALPATLGNLNFIKPNLGTQSLSLIFSVLLLAESYFYLNGDYYRFRDDYHQVGPKLVESGKGALDFLLGNNLPSPIYNNFDIGSYIINRGYPKYKVFVDGRPEGYPAKFFQEVYIPSQGDYSKFKELEKKWAFKTMIFSHTDQTPWGKAFVQSVVKDPAWELVYIDDFMMVLVTNDVAKEKKLMRVDLSKLSAISYSFSNHRSYLNLGLFLLNTQNIYSGKQFIEKALQIFPNSPVGNSIMASLTGQTAYVGIQNNFFW